MSKYQTSAGAAAVDISPASLSEGRIWLGGYKPDRYADNRHDPIEARALAIGGGVSGMIIVTVDTCLVSPLTATAWARAISNATGLPPRRVFIVTTHTHSGPDLSFFFGGVPLDYFSRVGRGILDAAVCARAALEPAEMFAGTARHTPGMPRRVKRGQRDWDDELVLLQWRGENGTIATLMNLACHGVVLPRTSSILSGDLPAALCRRADREFGGVSMFAPRDQGDVNPDLPSDNPYYQEGTVEDLEKLARSGLEAMRSAAGGAVPVSSSPVTVRAKRFDVRIKKASMRLLNGPWWTGRVPWPGTASIEMRKFRIGDIEGAALPAEILTCLGTKIISGMAPPALLMSCTGGYRGYLMTPETFSRGGYETTVSPGPVDPELML